MIKGKKSDSRMDLKEIHISEKYRDNIESLILRNSDLFASKDTELQHTDTVRMKFDKGNADRI